MKKLLSVLIMLSFIGCATVKCKYDSVLPPDPVMLEVHVVNGTVSGHDLDNLIENYLRLWQHIELLKKKGFSDKQVKSTSVRLLSKLDVKNIK